MPSRRVGALARDPELVSAGFAPAEMGPVLPKAVSCVFRRCQNTLWNYKQIISYLHLTLNYLTLLQRETVRIR